MSDLANRKYIRWDTDGVESIKPGEIEDIGAVAGQINEIQRLYCQKNSGHCLGGTHARTQGIVKGTFIVSDDLAPHLKQTELFEKGGKYPTICRYSSEPSDPFLDDRLAQPRGFAMKLFNVHGDMFEAGKDFPTQDIEFNSTPALDLADAKTTKEIIDLRMKYGADPVELDKHIGARDDKELQRARTQVWNTHLESTRFYSQTAYRFGDYVVKYNLVPSSEVQKKRAKESVDGHPDGVLHEWLREFYKENDADYLFQVQLLENLDDQPVEYAGKEWDAEKYPWQTVAKLVIPKQESFDEKRNQFWVDDLRIDPWHGLVKFQPLGSPNRLRRIVYPASSKYRRQHNGRTEINVKSMDEVVGF